MRHRCSKLPRCSAIVTVVSVLSFNLIHYHHWPIDYLLDCFQSYLKHSSLQRSCSFQGVPFEDSLQKLFSAALNAVTLHEFSPRLLSKTTSNDCSLKMDKSHASSVRWLHQDWVNWIYLIQTKEVWAASPLLPKVITFCPSCTVPPPQCPQKKTAHKVMATSLV